jgi:hypothetical protein
MDSPSGPGPTPGPGSKLLLPGGQNGSTLEPSLPLATGLIALFLEYTKDVPSPEAFRLWTAIHAVGASGERRVWTESGINALFPNLFVILVGPPGVGKTQAIRFIDPILRKANCVCLAPNDISKESLLDCLAESKRGAVYNGVPFDYHFVALSIREMSNFMSDYDNRIAGILTDLFDCPEFNDEKKRTHNKGQFIPFPGLSFIMGTATQNLGNTISDKMWDSGFMARVIMVYDDTPSAVEDFFVKAVKSEQLAQVLVNGFNKLGKLVGPMRWSPEAQAAFNAFRKSKKDDAPMHNRLASYTDRRDLHLGKLVMIAALSDLTMDITLDHFLRALLWLKGAETRMPDIFRGMLSHGDGQIYEEFRAEMFMIYVRTGMGLPSSIMFDWLKNRVPHGAVQRVFDIALEADMFRRKAGSPKDDPLWIPQAKPKGLSRPGVI